METAVRHGGQPSGRGRKDGLPPGSPQAIAADKEKDRLRKEAARAVAKKITAEPAALPPAVPGAGSAAPGGSAPVSPGGPAPTIVPWQAEIIKPLVEKLLDAAEEGRVAAFVAKCKQLGDMPKLIKEIEEDSHFPAAAKVLLVTSLPRLAAKWLNHTGISAEYQDEIAVITAILLIIQHDRKASARIDKLIAAQKASKQPEPKKEPTQMIFAGAAPDPAPAADRKPAEPAAAAAPALGSVQQIATIKQ